MGFGRWRWDALTPGGTLEWGCVVEDSMCHDKALYLVGSLPGGTFGDPTQSLSLSRLVLLLPWAWSQPRGVPQAEAGEAHNQSRTEVGGSALGGP